MDKQKLIQECLDEIGVKGTDKEQSTRALLEQLYDKKPQDITDTKFIQNLLIEIQKKQKRKKKGIFGLIKRYRAVLVTASLSLLVVIGIWSILPRQNTDIEPTNFKTITVNLPTENEPINGDNTTIKPKIPKITKTIDSNPKPEIMMIDLPLEDEPLKEVDAISTLMYEFEELLEYQDTNTIAPKSIRTQKSDSGRFVAFIIEGSGKKTIISAECYEVSQERTITKIGNFKSLDTDLYDNFDISLCK